MNAETTRDELFRLATGVVDPAFRPMFLDADNRNAGRAPSLKAAWDSDRAFCCGLRSEVVPVDIDSAQVHLLPAYRDAIEASKQAFVEAASSGTDSANRHFFIWAPADTDHEHLVDTLRHMGGREPVRIGQPIRLPGVRHRCHSTRSTPVDRRQVAAMLSAITDHDTKPQDVIADRLMGRLSPPTRRLINDGPSTDRSTWDMSVTHRLLTDGLPTDEVVHFGLNSATKFSEKAREKERRRPESGAHYLRLGINKAESFRKNGSLGIRSREDAIRLLDARAGTVAKTDYRVFGGLTAHRVLEGCIELFTEQSTVRTATTRSNRC